MNALTPSITTNYPLDEVERMARAFAGSKLFGVQTPEQAIALCLIASAEGRHPASAAQDYHIIQGKPSKKADAMLRDFIAGGGKVEWHRLDDTVADATFSHPAGGSVRITWDHARAKQAQISTPMWKKYPRQMLRSRVVSEGVRTVYPMATSGMYVPEEVVEFTPAKEPAAVQAEATTIDGDVVEPTESKALSKAKSRDTYTEMQAEIDACGTVDDLKMLWRSRAFKETFETLPEDWKALLIERFNERTDDLTPPAQVAAVESLDSQFPGDIPITDGAAP